MGRQPPLEARDTANGSTTVTLTAPSRDGVVTLLVVAGDERTAFTLNIGTDPATLPPPPPPPEPEATITFGGESGFIAFANLGSIDDALALVCGDATASIITSASDASTVEHIEGAPGFANIAFTNGVEFPAEALAAFVTCS